MTVDASQAPAAAGAPAATAAPATFFPEIAGPAGTAGDGDAGDAGDNFTADEAAAEIERLRAETDKWTALARKHERENTKLKKAAGSTGTAAAPQTGGTDAAAASRQAADEELRQENLRLRIGMKKGLPANLVDRLKGTDEEEMEADADELLELFKASKPSTRPAGRADGGAGGSTQKPPTFRDQINQALASGRTTLRG